MQLVSIISTSIDKLKRRLVKVRRFGNDDVQEPFQANNYGIDSNPIKGMVAVYSSTSENGKNVIIGYLNKNELADIGETRIYSTDENGNLKTFIWLKNDGKIELGGTIDHAVRYQKLQDGLDSMVNLINENLPLIQAGIAAGGGSYTPVNITLNISDAKIDEITTP